MDLSDDGLRLIQRFESCRLRAYLDLAGIPTIGWGTTVYPDGMRVQLGQTCTQAEADTYFRSDLHRFEHSVDGLTTDSITSHQHDALVSFCYNCGESAYRGSTLRRLVNANPDDPAVRGGFMMWYHAGGQPSLGLWHRRHDEADFYFAVSTPYPPFPG